MAETRRWTIEVLIGEDGGRAYAGDMAQATGQPSRRLGDET